MCGNGAPTSENVHDTLDTQYVYQLQERTHMNNIWAMRSVGVLLRGLMGLTGLLFERVFSLKESFQAGARAHRLHGCTEGGANEANQSSRGGLDPPPDILDHLGGVWTPLLTSSII